MEFFRRKRNKNTEVSKSPQSNEFATVINWSPIWDGGAPMPQVFSNGFNTFLIYRVNEPDPAWNGSYSKIVEDKSEKTHHLALVIFEGETFRFGIANDEVLNGLPLYKKGLKPYHAHKVEHSAWLEELKSIHQVHPMYSKGSWDKKTHYLFLFKDEIFEIIATDYKIETFTTSFKELAIKVANRMNK